MAKAAYFHLKYKLTAHLHFHPLYPVFSHRFMCIIRIKNKRRKILCKILGFALNQTSLNSIKFIEKCSNIYNTKLVTLDLPWKIFSWYNYFV